MASSDVDIANRALSLLGSPAITSLTDGSREASLCNRVLADTRKACLRAGMWNFAKARMTLDTPQESEINDFSYAHQLPEDFVRLIQVDDGRTEFALESGFIYTDSEEIEIRYIWLNTVVSNYDSLFVEVMAHWLAWVITMPLTQSQSQKDNMWAELEKILPRAKHVNATELYDRSLQTETWTNSRRNPATDFVRDPQT
jgi:hypothetical protein